ncbi:MAG: Choline-sulfatase, partial [uncultured Rubrobacteraceae bacterium]
ARIERPRSRHTDEVTPGLPRPGRRVGACGRLRHGPRRRRRGASGGRSEGGGRQERRQGRCRGRRGRGPRGGPGVPERGGDTHGRFGRGRPLPGDAGAHAQPQGRDDREGHHLRELVRHQLGLLPEPGDRPARPVRPQPPGPHQRAAARGRGEISSLGRRRVHGGHLATGRRLPDLVLRQVPQRLLRRLRPAGLGRVVRHLGQLPLQLPQRERRHHQ